MLENAISLSSEGFQTILIQLASFKPMIVFGMIEREGQSLFNTAVIIKAGILVGKYRKTHLLEGEKLFTAGTDYPVFEVEGLKFGINICYDTQFAETASSLAGKGARLILCPANNMMRYATAEYYKDRHHEMRTERARENGVWLMSADITGERDGRICYGPTSVINPKGIVESQFALMKTGIVFAEVS